MRTASVQQKTEEGGILFLLKTCTYIKFPKPTRVPLKIIAKD